MSESDPAVTLELLDARLLELEEQAARHATWTLVGLLGVLGLAVLLAGVAELAAAQSQRHTTALLRTCAIGAARMPRGPGRVVRERHQWLPVGPSTDGRRCVGVRLVAGVGAVGRRRAVGAAADDHRLPGPPE